MLTQNNLQTIRKVTRESIQSKTHGLLTKDIFFERTNKLSDEIQAMRNELAAHATSHTRIDTDLDDHESRIKKLEQH